MRLFELFTKTSFSFDTKRPDEKVLGILYRYWIVLVLQLSAFFILLLLPFAVKIAFSRYIYEFGLNDLYNLVAAVYLLIWWLGLFYNVTMYLLDIWIITDHRIIDNRQYGFFNHFVSELSLPKIQDISIEIRGVLPTFLDFGDIEIQTAGTELKFIFKQIHHPDKIKETITRAHNEYKITHPGDLELNQNGAI